MPAVVRITKHCDDQTKKPIQHKKQYYLHHMKMDILSTVVTTSACNNLMSRIHEKQQYNVINLSFHCTEITNKSCAQKGTTSNVAHLYVQL